MSATDWLTGIGTALLGLAAIGTVGVAAWGVNSWQKEMVGRSRYNTAKAILRAAYLVKVAFSVVRFPGVSQAEYPQHLKKPKGLLSGGLTRPERYEANLYVYDNRWKVLADSFTELENRNSDAIAEWGPDVDKYVAELRGRRAELKARIVAFLEEQKAPLPFFTTKIPELPALDKVLYSTGSIDKFARQIDHAVNEMENFYRPHVT